MSAKVESFDISLGEASRTFKALGADNPCPMCGGDTWHSVLDGDRAHLALPLYTNDGRPLADGAVIPVMFLVCGNCLFIRLHPTRGILQKAAEVEAAEKSALATEIEALREEVEQLRRRMLNG